MPCSGRFFSYSLELRCSWPRGSLFSGLGAKKDGRPEGRPERITVGTCSETLSRGSTTVYKEMLLHHA